MIACDLARAVALRGVPAGGTATRSGSRSRCSRSCRSSRRRSIRPRRPRSRTCVEGEDLATANALGGSLWGTMLAVGAALGGVVATVFGTRDGDHGRRRVVRDLGLLLSGDPPAVLGGARGRGAPRARSRPRSRPSQYAAADHRVLSLLAVKVGCGLAAGVLVLIPVFAVQVFDAGDIGVRVADGRPRARRAHRPVRRAPVRRGPTHRRLFPAIGIALGVFGARLHGARARARRSGLAAVVIFVAHLGGGAQWMLSTYGLQRIVPDHIRGRVFAVDFAMITLSFALSSLAAAATRGLVRAARRGVDHGRRRRGVGGRVVVAHAATCAARRRCDDEPPGPRRGPGPD